MKAKLNLQQDTPPNVAPRVHPSPPIILALRCSFLLPLGPRAIVCAQLSVSSLASLTQCFKNLYRFTKSWLRMKTAIGMTCSCAWLRMLISVLLYQSISLRMFLQSYY